MSDIAGVVDRLNSIRIVPAALEAAELWFHREITETSPADAALCVVFEDDAEPVLSLRGWWKYSTLRKQDSARGSRVCGRKYFCRGPDARAWAEAELPLMLTGFWSRDRKFFCDAPLATFIPTDNVERLTDQFCSIVDHDPNVVGRLALIHDTAESKAIAHFVASYCELPDLGDAWTEPRIVKKHLRLSKTLTIVQYARVFAKLDPYKLGFCPEFITDNGIQGPVICFGTAIIPSPPTVTCPDLDFSGPLGTRTKDNLKLLCRQNHLNVTGTKSDLITRLSTFFNNLPQLPADPTLLLNTFPTAMDVHNRYRPPPPSSPSPSATGGLTTSSPAS